MDTPLHVLVIEDSENDANLLLHQLRKADYAIHSDRVETADEMKTALDMLAWDIIIADYKLPQFNASDALTLLKKTGLDIPFIVVSSTIGEETAVELMKAGAHDYLTKGNLARLVPTVKRELDEAKIRQERQQAEKKLQESEERYRVFINSTDDMAFLKDNQLKYILVNRSNAAFFGKTKAEIIGKTDFDLMPQKAAQQWCESDKKVFDSDDVTINEELVGDRIYEFHKFKVPLNNGMYGVGGYIKDITERKQAEEALRKSEEHYKVISELTSDYIYKLNIDAAGKVTMDFISENFSAITGRKLEDIKELYMWTSIFYPDDLDRVMQLLQFMVKSQQTGEIECHTYTKDGKSRWVYVTAKSQWSDLEQRVVSITGSIKDITERKHSEEALRKSEERYRTLAEASHDMIFIISHDDLVEYVNTSAAELFHKRPEEVIGKKRESLFPSEVSSGQKRSLQNVFETGISNYDQNHKFSLERALLDQRQQFGGRAAQIFLELLGQLARQHDLAPGEQFVQLAQQLHDAVGRFVEDERAGDGP